MFSADCFILTKFCDVILLLIPSHRLFTNCHIFMNFLPPSKRDIICEGPLTNKFSYVSSPNFNIFIKHSFTVRNFHSQSFLELFYIMNIFCQQKMNIFANTKLRWLLGLHWEKRKILCSTYMTFSYLHYNRRKF